MGERERGRESEKERDRGKGRKTARDGEKWERDRERMILARAFNLFFFSLFFFILKMCLKPYVVSSGPIFF